MATTFTKIADYTVGSGGAASIDFTSIPSTYTDLCVQLSTRSSTSNTDDYIMVYFNNTQSSLTSKRLYGTGSSTGSDSLSNKQGGSAGTRIMAGATTGNGATSNTFGNFSIYIPNYAGSTNKSTSSEGVGEANATAATALIGAGLWSSTAAINQITFDVYFSGANFMQYSTATLYGVNNA
jgi:hypothetical protein